MIQFSHLSTIIPSHFSSDTLGNPCLHIRFTHWSSKSPIALCYNRRNVVARYLTTNRVALCLSTVLHLPVPTLISEFFHLKARTIARHVWQDHTTWLLFTICCSLSPFSTSTDRWVYIRRKPVAEKAKPMCESFQRMQKLFSIGKFFPFYFRLDKANTPEFGLAWCDFG